MLLSWLQLDSLNSATKEDTEVHLTALAWGLLLTLFGCIVIKMETRNPVAPLSQHLRDRIFGVEQRYFIVILNGFLLYGTLLKILKKPIED